MARTKGETSFAQSLGRIGEHVIAPILLPRMGINDFRNLNEEFPNFPWADFLGRQGQTWVGIAVRTRVNWEKPAHFSKARINGSFNGSGISTMCKAREKLAVLAKSDPDEIRLLWLAIAIDIDNTYEAYWGHSEEMTEIGVDKNRIRIPMTTEARDEYGRGDRRVAYQEPISVPWLDHPANWTFAAYQRWTELDSVTDRNRRILEAIAYAASRDPFAVHSMRLQPRLVATPPTAITALK